MKVFNTVNLIKTGKPAMMKVDDWLSFLAQYLLDHLPILLIRQLAELFEIIIIILCFPTVSVLVYK